MERANRSLRTTNGIAACRRRTKIGYVVTHVTLVLQPPISPNFILPYFRYTLRASRRTDVEYTVKLDRTPHIKSWCSDRQFHPPTRISFYFVFFCFRVNSPEFCCFGTRALRGITIYFTSLFPRRGRMQHTQTTVIRF